MFHIFLVRAWKKELDSGQVSSTVARTLPLYSHKQKAPELYSRWYLRLAFIHICGHYSAFSWLNKRNHLIFKFKVEIIEDPVSFPFVCALNNFSRVFMSVSCVPIKLLSQCFPRKCLSWWDCTYTFPYFPGICSYS